MGTTTSARPATRFRRLFTVLIAVALATGGLAGVGRGPAVAQDDVDQITQREFDRLTRAAQRGEVVFGPEDGTLDLDDSGFDSASADLEVESFALRAEFANPSDPADAPWDYGFIFRAQGQDTSLGLILLSDGTWGALGPEDIVEDGVITTGMVEAVNDGEGDTNVIDLYVEGDIGHFGLNGDYVATFELPVDGVGDVIIGSGFLNDDGQPNAETAYTGFIVWTLDEGSLGPDDETPDPDDLSDDDLTATAEAEEDDLSDRDLTRTAEADEEDLSDDDLTATADAEDEELSDRDLTRTAEAEDEELSDDDLTATADAEEEDEDATATAEAEGDDETPESGGGDPTYTSPAFGYTLSYDDPWELDNEVSENDGDLLELISSGSTLQIVGNETRDTPEECVDTLLDDLADNRDVSNDEIAQDEQDRDLRDDSDELSWVVVFFTLAGEDDEEIDITGYYECRVIVEGDSLLTVIHLALSDDYNDEIENRTAVLDTIEIDGGSGGDDETRTPTEEPEEDETVTPDPDDEETPTQEPDDEPTAGATAEVAEGTIFVLLKAVGDSEILPFGSIEPTGADESRVFLFAIGAGGSLVTIHEGSCRTPGDVAFEVSQIDETGLLNETIEVATEDISTGEFVMLVSTDGTGETALACGVLEPPVEE